MPVELKLCCATGYGNIERIELKLVSGQSRFLYGANSLLLQEEYFSYSGNDSFHDYIHHMHWKSVVRISNRSIKLFVNNYLKELLHFPFILGFRETSKCWRATCKRTCKVGRKDQWTGEHERKIRIIWKG